MRLSLCGAPAASPGQARRSDRNRALSSVAYAAIAASSTTPFKIWAHDGSISSSGTELLMRARNIAPSSAPTKEPRPPVITAPPRNTAAKTGSA